LKRQFKKLFKQNLSEIFSLNWPELIPALLILAPILLIFLFTHNVQFFNIALVSISLLIIQSRLRLNWALVTGHYALILITFSILYFSFPTLFLFVPLVSLLGFFTIYLSRYGEDFRTLGNYIFIPAVYLSCELRSAILNNFSQVDSHNFFNLNFLFFNYFHFIFLTLISYFSILIICFLNSKIKKNFQKLKLKFLKKINPLNNSANQHWLSPAFAIFIVTGIASTLVLIWHTPKAEWMIWSAASVITLDLKSAKEKLFQRSLGVFIGIPLGFLVSYFLLPKLDLIYTLASLGIVLSLVAFKNYILAFGSRCFLLVIATYISTSNLSIALDRIENVLFGGVLGLVCLYLCEKVRKINAKFNKKFNKIT